VEVVLGIEVEVDDVVAEGLHGVEATGLRAAGGVGGAHVSWD